MTYHNPKTNLIFKLAFNTDDNENVSAETIDSFLKAVLTRAKHTNVGKGMKSKPLMIDCSFPNSFIENNYLNI